MRRRKEEGRYDGRKKEEEEEVGRKENRSRKKRKRKKREEEGGKEEKVGKYNKRTRTRMSRIILNSSLSKWFKMDSGETLTTRRQWRRGGRTGGKGH